MSTATFNPAAHAPRPRHAAHAAGSADAPQGVGGALRAVKVFVGAVFSVAVLGDYAEEAGVRRP